jgi:cytosine/adenosine deaminase-related metal-dependent hydrolase
MDRPRDIRFFHADGVLDAEGVCAAPGSLLVEITGDSPCVLAAGTPEDVAGRPESRVAQRIDLPGMALLPGLINAHTHLDLTHVGPREYDPVRDQFGDWLAMILRQRATTDGAIRDSVRLGIERSLAGGVVAVGDIAGVWSTVPLRTLRGSPMAGVSFIEAFGSGVRQEASAERIGAIVGGVALDDRGVRVGVSPHAPYTVGLRLYERMLEIAGSSGMPLATHLAESEPEHEFIAGGGGLFRDLLDSMGLWDESIREEVGRGATPISHFFTRLGEAVGSASQRSPILLVHCNDVNDRDLDTLAASPVSVAYCPRSSAYFGAERRFGPHRYAEMLGRGINVALGTDSIVNLPLRSDGRNPTISTLDEMRFLHERDGDSGGCVPARLLLAMATTNAARALGMDPSRFTLAPGPIEGLISVEIGGGIGPDRLAEAVAQSSGDPALLAGPARQCPVKA